MTQLFIAVDEETFVHKITAKSPDEVRHEIEMGVFQFPVPLTDPAAVQLRDNLLITERDKDPMLSRTQRNILDLLSLGASETEIARAMRKKDRARRAYYEHYTDQEWGDCHNYDLALNSGTLGFDACVRYVCEAARDF